MPYKMIVLDLDDTLLRDNHTISPRTKESLLEAQKMGVKVVLASGRPTFGMRPIVDELSLAEYGSFILSYNGGKILNSQTYEELFSSTLTPKMIHMLSKISAREGVYVHTYIGDEIITDQNNPYTTIESELTGLPIKLIKDFTREVKEPAVKVLMSAEPELLKRVEAKLKVELESEYSIMRSKPYFLEFTERGVTKGSSLHRLTQILGINREEVIAIGDSYNDLSMIEFAGLGVAMGNAPDEIKQAANHITDTNINDGVAKVVEDFVLTNKVHR